MLCKALPYITVNLWIKLFQAPNIVLCLLLLESGNLSNKEISCRSILHFNYKTQTPKNDVDFFGRFTEPHGDLASVLLKNQPKLKINIKTRLTGGSVHIVPLSFSQVIFSSELKILILFY